jgi:hypothetical protein
MTTSTLVVNDLDIVMGVLFWICHFFKVSVIFTNPMFEKTLQLENAIASFLCDYTILYSSEYYFYVAAIFTIVSCIYEVAYWTTFDYIKVVKGDRYGNPKAVPINRPVDMICKFAIASLLISINPFMDSYMRVHVKAILLFTLRLYQANMIYRLSVIERVY